MSFIEKFAKDFASVESLAGDSAQWFERVKAEFAFVKEMILAKPKEEARLSRMLEDAIEAFRKSVQGGEGFKEAVFAAEKVLQPVGKLAKEYTFHLVGHAHIDMNWMWSWPETVATTNDTYTTADRLMDEFPGFTMGQSQASVYQILLDYCPELAERMKKRIREGRLEVTASQWVEGDKNLAGGEILCRHLLYTRRFFKKEFGLDYDSVQIDWEPDTFGHMNTLPGILARGGVKYYYMHRGQEGPMMFWWEGKDGSRVLVFDDYLHGYNYRPHPAMHDTLFRFEKETGLKDLLVVYGVGDHGGGPTRAHLTAALLQDSWPIYPNLKFSATKTFFKIAEKGAKNLPVVKKELNFTLDACYTSEARIKKANRKSECYISEAESFALLGGALVKMPYPGKEFESAWRRAMFSQFHDILPGSGVPETIQYAMGSFQEILATTSLIKTRSLRAIADKINTALLPDDEPMKKQAGDGVGPGIGGGPGDLLEMGGVSRYGAGAVASDYFVVFNPSPWEREDVAFAKLWDRGYANNTALVVNAEKGEKQAAQFVGAPPAWGHQCIEVAFETGVVKGLGYKAFRIGKTIEKIETSGCSGDGMGFIENEFYRIQVEPKSGAITSLKDKKSGTEFVAEGGRIGLLEYYLECPHPMTAWTFGQIIQERPFSEGATSEFVLNGPHYASVKSAHKFSQSKFTYTVALKKGSPVIERMLDLDWYERGTPETGVPMLKVAFPLALCRGVASFETANGHVERSSDPRDIPCRTNWLLGKYYPDSSPMDKNPAEVPGQKWCDLTGGALAGKGKVGAVLLNDCKYGFSVRDNVLRMTLLRGSYDPDPMPDLGKHVIRFGLIPHTGGLDPAKAHRAGLDFNLPLTVAGTRRQKGDLPLSAGYLEIEAQNVCLGGLKKAEDTSALIMRLYETDGKATTAKVRLDQSLVKANATAVETDLLERPLEKSSAKFEKGVLTVKLPPYGTATVRMG